MVWRVFSFIWLLNSSEGTGIICGTWKNWISPSYKVSGETFTNKFVGASRLQQKLQLLITITNFCSCWVQVSPKLLQILWIWLNTMQIIHCKLEKIATDFGFIFKLQQLIDFWLKLIKKLIEFLHVIQSFYQDQHIPTNRSMKSVKNIIIAALKWKMNSFLCKNS